MLIPQVVVLLGKAAEHLWKQGLLAGRSRSWEDIIDGYTQSPLPVLQSASWMRAAFATCSHHHQVVALPYLPCHDELNPRKMSIKIGSDSLKLFWLDLQKICTREWATKHDHIVLVSESQNCCRIWKGWRWGLTNSRLLKWNVRGDAAVGVWDQKQTDKKDSAHEVAEGTEHAIGKRTRVHPC